MDRLQNLRCGPTFFLKKKKKKKKKKFTGRDMELIEKLVKAAQHSRTDFGLDPVFPVTHHEVRRGASYDVGGGCGKPSKITADRAPRNGPGRATEDGDVLSYEWGSNEDRGRVREAPSTPTNSQEGA